MYYLYDKETGKIYAKGSYLIAQRGLAVLNSKIDIELNNTWYVKENQLIQVLPDIKVEQIKIKEPEKKIPWYKRILKMMVGG